ncbi:MAG: chromosome segregation protein SMC [Actinomycetota bacterium]|nr:chromosome segregation protein SMC [Actinomycetota bacterium]MDD5666623.1 chromosome segregation protein SMC [Actinomycetota bacterium]
MYLKSLSARGFKSFADKVALDFEPGISVIVGPNGSGKSNVADAVLWVLGEQSPRNLRGTKMEDVIFAGSATRQPLSMAEVSLSFDNRSGDIPIEFPEVVVTRRIYRTGESEYLLNKTPCRLVDIQELLSDLGVGRELTAVIGQNKLEAILRSQPEDRRAFLEEAAGLRKHRKRKEKALRKMEGMERNLLRVKDIISEVNKQLRPLERQAQQAREYGELASSIRELSIRILVAELQELKGQWENRKEEEERLARDLEDTSAQVREGKERLSGLEERLRELRQALESCRAQEMRLLSLGERLRACESLGEERLKLYAALSGDISYRDGWRSRREELARRREELEEEKARAEAEASRLEEEIAGLRGKRKDLAAELNQARRERDSLRRALSEMRERERELREEAARDVTRAEECCQETDGLVSRREEIAAEMDALQDRAAGMESELAEIGNRQARTGEMTAELRENLARLREELDALAAREKSSFRDEALVTARLQALQEVFDSRIDHAAAADRVMREGEGIPGILGTLMDRMEVEGGWEKALESFLGPWMFCVVTRDLDCALDAVRMLKKEEEGYGIFLPLSEIAGDSMEQVKNLAREAGGVPALDVVECASEIRPALEYLLAEVVFCASLDEARSRAELYPRLTFVTAEGDVIAARRAVKGGAQPHGPFHIVASRREIERLREAAGLRGEEVASLEEQRDSVLSNIKGIEKDLGGLADEEKEQESAARRLVLACRETALQVERMEADAAQLDARLESLRQEEAELHMRGAALEEQAKEKAAERQALEPELAAGESRVEELRREDRELEESLQQMLAQKASTAERGYHLGKRIREIDAETQGPPLPGREELAAMMEAQEEILSLVGKMTEAHGRLAEYVSRRESESRRELEGVEIEQEQSRTRIVELEAREGELRELVHNRDLAAAQLKMRVDMLVQRLLDEYRLPVETALTDYLPTEPVAEMREKLERQERRRDMLGQVNMRAVEEYSAMKERYDFLMEQVEDLRESKASLLKVVRAIDREIVRIFKETFEEVNLHFQELFEMLFPQGRAELTLSDPTDPLNTGVEVEAQPRGKRLKKLSLLSGGETSLTSLAFLFAIFKTRPSPFYFLDEVEAALDDVNLHRFLNMLKEFKGDSQLIVITHQKRTMEIADILYGVSMQASGVSRIVSQKLDEAERLARTGT